MFLTKVGKKTAASIFHSVWYVDLEFLPFTPLISTLFLLGGFFWEAKSFCGAELHSGVGFCDLCKTNAARVPLAGTTKCISRTGKSEHIGWMWQIRFRGSETTSLCSSFGYLSFQVFPGSFSFSTVNVSNTLSWKYEIKVLAGESLSYVSLKALLLCCSSFQLKSSILKLTLKLSMTLFI